MEWMNEFSKSSDCVSPWQQVGFGISGFRLSLSEQQGATAHNHGPSDTQPPACFSSRKPLQHKHTNPLRRTAWAVGGAPAASGVSYRGRSWLERVHLRSLTCTGVSNPTKTIRGTRRRQRFEPRRTSCWCSSSRSVEKTMSGWSREKRWFFS